MLQQIEPVDFRTMLWKLLTCLQAADVQLMRNQQTEALGGISRETVLTEIERLVAQPGTPSSLETSSRGG